MVDFVVFLQEKLMKTVIKLLILLMFVISFSGCKQESEKNLIGLYEGNITYYEKGKDPVTVHDVSMKLTLFTDDIPTSSKYRAKLEIDTFVVVGVSNPWKNASDLLFPGVTTEHNILHDDGQFTLQFGETTADFGFPIPYPVHVEGVIDNLHKARINIKIAASFGIGKEFVFEGGRLRLRSIPVKLKNLTSPLEKPVSIDVF